MTYKEIEKELDALNKENEIVFRTAIYHLLDVGIRHLTAENITETCEEIRKQDDSQLLMTNDFQCAIVEMAGKLAKYDIMALCVYFGKFFKDDIKFKQF